MSPKPVLKCYGDQNPPCCPRFEQNGDEAGCQSFRLRVLVGLAIAPIASELDPLSVPLSWNAYHTQTFLATLLHAVSP